MQEFTATDRATAFGEAAGTIFSVLIFGSLAALTLVPWM
jgi:hypothetical protein